MKARTFSLLLLILIDLIGCGKVEGNGPKKDTYEFLYETSKVIEEGSVAQEIISGHDNHTDPNSDYEIDADSLMMEGSAYDAVNNNEENAENVEAAKTIDHTKKEEQNKYGNIYIIPKHDLFLDDTLEEDKFELYYDNRIVLTNITGIEASMKNFPGTSLLWKKGSILYAFIASDEKAYILTDDLCEDHDMGVFGLALNADKCWYIDKNEDLIFVDLEKKEKEKINSGVIPNNTYPWSSCEMNVVISGNGENIAYRTHEKYYVWRGGSNTQYELSSNVWPLSISDGGDILYYVSSVNQGDSARGVYSYNFNTDEVVSLLFEEDFAQGYFCPSINGEEMLYLIRYEQNEQNYMNVVAGSGTPCELGKVDYMYLLFPENIWYELGYYKFEDELRENSCVRQMPVKTFNRTYFRCDAEYISTIVNEGRERWHQEMVANNSYECSLNLKDNSLVLGQSRTKRKFSLIDRLTFQKSYSTLAFSAF